MHPKQKGLQSLTIFSTKRSNTPPNKSELELCNQQGEGAGGVSDMCRETATSKHRAWALACSRLAAKSLFYVGCDCCKIICKLTFCFDAPEMYLADFIQKFKTA